MKLINENIDKYINERKELSFYNPYDDDVAKVPENISLYDAGVRLEKTKDVFKTPATEVLRVKNGYAVKASKDFRKDEIIERAPVILQSSDILRFDILKDIVFEIDKENGIYAIVLGNGSLYSHSEKPNIDYAWDKTHDRMCFVARRKIKKGEMLTINYGFDYWQARVPNHIKPNIDKTIAQIEENSIDPAAVAPYPDANPKINKDNLHNYKNFKSNPANTGQPIMTGQP